MFLLFSHILIFLSYQYMIAVCNVYILCMELVLQIKNHNSFFITVTTSSSVSWSPSHFKEISISLFLKPCGKITVYCIIENCFLNVIFQQFQNFIYLLPFESKLVFHFLTVGSQYDIYTSKSELFNLWVWFPVASIYILKPEICLYLKLISMSLY